LWFSTYLAQLPVVLDILGGGDKKSHGGIGNLVELLVFFLQFPGGYAAYSLRFTDEHLYLRWILAIVANAAIYMLLLLLVVLLRSPGAQAMTPASGVAGLIPLRVAQFCGFIFVINLLSTIFLCFNTNRIAFFDSGSRHVVLVMVVSALSLSLSGAACWWSYKGWASTPRTKCEE